MSSYFVASAAHGQIAVHDRSRCQPGAFRLDATAEYLGEFLDATQALAVARLRYSHVRGCACCAPEPAASAVLAHAVPAAAQPLNPS